MQAAAVLASIRAHGFARVILGLDVLASAHCIKFTSVKQWADAARWRDGTNVRRVPARHPRKT